MKVTKELRGLSIDDLNARIKESKKELLKLNVHVASGTSTTNPGKLRQLKKNVARILTLIKEKEVINK